MRRRRHTKWMDDFDTGMMILGQSGIYDTFWFQERKWVNVRRELFYRGGVSGELEAFTLEQMAMPFVLLLAGIGAAVAGLLVERCF